jgi:predicted small metal-binding protein
VACGCGFVVEGGEDEVVDVARRHASDVHGIELTDAFLRALTEPT